MDKHQNYNDGIRANFNNGRFGFILGLYDGYWKNSDFNSDKVGIDIGASLMIVPGLEYRIGYALTMVSITAGLTIISLNLTLGCPIILVHLHLPLSTISSM